MGKSLAQEFQLQTEISELGAIHKKLKLSDDLNYF